jgi:heterodisulfide reductase subunit A-like polyferredoxin
MSETLPSATNLQQGARSRPCVSTVLIIGGGIAGLSAAIALSRVGVQCNVVEIADSVSTTRVTQPARRSIATRPPRTSTTPRAA